MNCFSRARVEPDDTRAETTFRLSPKRTSPFISVGELVQSTAGSRGVCVSVSNAGYTMFRGRMRVMATHSIRQFPLQFPSRASPCATRFRTQYTSERLQEFDEYNYWNTLNHMEDESEINEKYKDLEGIVASYNNFWENWGRNETRNYKVTSRRLKGRHLNFGKS